MWKCCSCVYSCILSDARRCEFLLLGHRCHALTSGRRRPAVAKMISLTGTPSTSSARSLHSPVTGSPSFCSTILVVAWNYHILVIICISLMLNWVSTAFHVTSHGDSLSSGVSVQVTSVLLGWAGYTTKDIDGVRVSYTYSVLSDFLNHVFWRT